MKNVKRFKKDFPQTVTVDDKVGLGATLTIMRSGHPSCDDKSSRETSKRHNKERRELDNEARKTVRAAGFEGVEGRITTDDLMREDVEYADKFTGMIQRHKRERAIADELDLCRRVRSWKGNAFDDDELPNNAPKSEGKKKKSTDERLEFIRRTLFDNLPEDECPPMYFCENDPVTQEHDLYKKVSKLHNENEHRKEDLVTDQNESINVVCDGNEFLLKIIGETLKTKGGLEWFGKQGPGRSARMMIAAIKDRSVVSEMEAPIKEACKALCDSYNAQMKAGKAFEDALSEIGCRWCDYNDVNYRQGFARFIAAESLRAETEYQEKKGLFIRRDSNTST